MELKSELNPDALEDGEIEIMPSMVLRMIANRMLDLRYDSGGMLICPELEPLAEELIYVANEIKKTEPPQRKLTIPSSEASS